MNLTNARLLLFFLPFQIIISQTLLVHGIVSTQFRPVKYCTITFISTSDTSKQYTAVTDSTGYYLIDIPATVRNDGDVVPTAAWLEQNYPNPFTNQTAISYTVAKQTTVNLTVYNILGQEVKQLVNTFDGVGSRVVVWDGTNTIGNKVTPGIYFCRLKTERFTETRKMMYLGTGSMQFPFSASSTGSFIHNTLDKDLKKITAPMYHVIIESADTTDPLTVPTRCNNYSLNVGVNNFTVDSARIIIGKSIDGVEIGDDSATVKQKLGDTYESQTDYGWIFYYLEGPHKTMFVYVLIGGEGAPTNITGVTNVDIQPPYVGESKEGIKLGVQRDFVWQKLGKPFIVDTLTAYFLDTYIYEKKDSTNNELLVGYALFYKKDSKNLTRIIFNRY